MKISKTQITQELTRICANYYRQMTPELIDLFWEEFANTQESVFKRAVKWWITHNDAKMPTVAQLKKTCAQIYQFDQKKADELVHGGVLPCQFDKFAKPEGYVECEWSRKLCCKNDIRFTIGNSRLCEFHYELRQEWCKISQRFVNWTGDTSMPWTQAEILKIRYQSGDNADAGNVLLGLTPEQRDFVMAAEHLVWKIQNQEKLGSIIFRTVNDETKPIHQILSA